MQDLYPSGPASFPPSLTQASASYKRQAWLAMLALSGFIALYLVLSGWFAWKAWRMFYAAAHGSDMAVPLVLLGIGAAFMAVFMLKALVFIKRGDTSKLSEITAETQPALFRFLYRLADEAGAPRPRKVFLSPRVNAAVFYDLSPINLFFPSRKNLEIGMGLVNVLTMSEFKAVLAHEFGHFAQRSMAVGRWVYVAQQIAAHIVSKRDGLDEFLRSLSTFDYRIAWVGWILSLLIWSIRSLVDSFFRLVLLADRALSREMEFQADRVAVGLTGSDALIHALYRFRAADSAWDRTLAFANDELAHGRATADMFEIQSLVMARLGEILNDPAFSPPPPHRDAEPAQHRIFKREMTQLSRMWATHPFNHEREENAKKIYLGVELDNQPAWAIFAGADALKRKVSADMVSHIDPAPVVATREQSLAALAAEFDRASFLARYCGLYLHRSLTRHATLPEQVYADGERTDAGQLYPASLTHDVKRFDQLLVEKNVLVGLRDGSGGDRQIEHRGTRLARSRLPAAIAEVEREIADLDGRLLAHERLCRSTARALAGERGDGWYEYWLGLVRLLHYAEHSQADVLDLKGSLANTVAMATAKRKVDQKGRERILARAWELHGRIAEVYRERANVLPDSRTLLLLNSPGWSPLLGPDDFGAPNAENLGQWLNVADGWADHVTALLGKLRRAALDGLLLTEAGLFGWDEAHVAGPAPEPARVIGSYSVLMAGDERPLQKKLDWWSRFHTADGWGPGVLRLAVAGGVVAGLMGADGRIGTTNVAVHNGLAQPVRAILGGQHVTLAPGQSQSLVLAPDASLSVTAATADGRQIESFSVDADLIGAHYVYNIAGAAALIGWTATYGNAAAPPERELGSPRWTMVSADAVLEKPPTSIQTKGGGGTRQVVSAAPAPSLRANLGMLGDEAARKSLILAHVRWDAPDSPDIMDWLEASTAYPELEALLMKRLNDQPLDVAAARMMQDYVDPAMHLKACERDRVMATSRPDSPDLSYLVARCLTPMAVQDAALAAGHAKYPGHAWFANAAANDLAAVSDWAGASKALDVALKFPPLSGRAALALARVRRLESGSQAGLDDLAKKSDTLRLLLAGERGDPGAPNSQTFYTALANGQLELARAAIDKAKALERPAMLRLLAASDGATAEWQRQALAAPLREGLDIETIWVAVGLAIRARRGFDELMPILEKMDRGEIMLAFARALQERDLKKADGLVRGSPPVERANAYSMAIVVLGKGVPADWRSYARRALFVGERPYFGT